MTCRLGIVLLAMAALTTALFAGANPKASQSLKGGPAQDPQKTPAPANGKAEEEELLCGPRAIAGAAARLGILLDYQKIADQCTLTKNGVSLLDLKNAARAFALDAEGVKLSWDQLAQLETPAVLFLTGHHFAFVDPRERNGAVAAGKVRLYDYPKVAQWMSKADLTREWQGEALLIRKPQQAQSAFEFNSILEDFGSVYAKQTVTHPFHFRNAGKETLKIIDVKKSCGCTKAETDKKEYRPGEAGVINVSIDLNGRQGTQRQVVFLRTNDPVLPVIPLTYQGVAMNPIHVSMDVINLGNVYPGNQSSVEFVVTDRSGGTLKLTAYRLKAEAKAPESPRPKVQVSWASTDAAHDPSLTSTSLNSRVVPISRGKGSVRYQVKALITIPEVTKFGLHESVLVLNTNDPNYSEVEIPLVYHVTQSFLASPDKVIFGIMRSSQVIRRSISLQWLDPKASGQGDYHIEVLGEESTLKPSVKLSKNAKGQIELEVLLDPSQKFEKLKKGLHQGAIRVQASDRQTVTIPWLYIVKRG
jgi:hypothetical protein